MANPYFNATYYLSKNPDVFAAGINTVEGAWNHYVTYGAREALEGADSRQPAAWFDAEYYLVNNPDLAIAGLTPGQLFEHFTTHGIGEGRAPSADVKLTEANLLAYAKANTDLLNAFDIDPDAEELTPTEYQALAGHFYQYGYYEDRPAKPVGGGDTPVDNMFFLSPESDYIIGTGGDDQFLAYLSQNPWAGGVSNTLSSGDYLDGVAGYDSLFAEVVPEFFGVTGDNQIDIQPRTKSVEKVEFEARDLPGWVSDDSNDGWGSGGVVVVDAKHMYGVERIGSKQSDGDLVIENLTTLANDGITKRNTSDLTITMDHTDNFNSDNDASDLTVLFDDNYLIAGEQSEFSIQLRIVNNFQLAENDAPLSGFQTVKFTVGEQQVVVDITTAQTYQQVADAINAQLATQGINGVHATTAPARTSIFSDDVPAGQGYKQGDLAGVYLPINIVSTNEELARGPIELESNIENFDGLNTWVDGDSTTTEDPVSVNIELTKVGRGGEGGDLLVGAKSLHQGIEVFNVTVKGGDHLPNNLGMLGSTGNALHTVNIASETGLESHASLTIREGFGDGVSQQARLLNVDANDFLGNLTIGGVADNYDRIDNVRDFTATGGGNVSYTSQVGEDSGLVSLGNLAYNIVTGGGSDTIDTNVFGGAQLILDSGAGDDTINVVLNGATDSGSTLSFADITSESGDNTVTVSQTGTSQHEAKITTDAGVDTINGNGVSITVSTGGGNDVIYAENTGSKAITEGWVYDQYTTAPLVGSNSSTYAVENFKLLAGREIRVTVAIPGDVGEFVNGFESVVLVAGQRGTLSSLADYNAAVQKAINEHPVLKHIARADVDSNGEIVVSYLVDGQFVTGDLDAVKVEVLGEITVGGAAGDVLTNTQRESLLDALRAEYSDSGINEASLVAAFNAVADVIVEADTLGGNSTTRGANVINAGTGNDVIVLSSAAADSSVGRFDIVEFDAGNFGNDTIVHFQSGEDGDVLDFAWLDMTYSVSGSTTSVRDSGIVFTNGPGTINLDNSTTASNAKNAVSVIDFNQLDDANVTVSDFTALLNLGASDLTTLINDTFTTNATNFASKHIFLIQNTDDDNVETTNDGNLGQYAVVQAETSATSADLTNVSIVGTLDFGVTQTFHIDNFFIA